MRAGEEPKTASQDMLHKKCRHPNRHRRHTRQGRQVRLAKRGRRKRRDCGRRYASSMGWHHCQGQGWNCRANSEMEEKRRQPTAGRTTKTSVTDDVDDVGCDSDDGDEEQEAPASKTALKSAAPA